MRKRQFAASETTFADITKYNRIIVVGSPGSGKTWLSEWIASLLRLPLTHLDREFYRPKWEPTPRDVWVAKQEKMIAGNRWLIDGNYGNTMEMRWKAAELVIFLDIGRFRCLLNLLQRTGRKRSDLPAYLDDPGFFSKQSRALRKRVLNEYPRRGTLQIAALRDRYPDTAFIRVTDRRQMKELINACKAYAETTGV